ncbi:unnamed protein product [Heterobilharzia americana]|nr:unnamed protein product [Heterobilharzia americana]
MDDQAEVDHVNVDSQPQTPESNYLQIDKIQSLTAESLLESVEDQVEKFTTNIPDTDANCSDPLALLTNLTSDSLLFTHSSSASQLIRLWENQLTNMCSQLKQFETRLDAARKIAEQSREYECSLVRNLMNYENQCKQILFWQETINIDLCKNRLDELQNLLAQSEESKADLKQAQETFNQLVKLSDISAAYHESSIQESDILIEEPTQTDDNVKSSKLSVYKSTVLLEIESRLFTVISCLTKAIHHITELISALDTQQRLYDDANSWLEQAASKLQTIMSAKQKTFPGRDTAKEYLDLLHNLSEKSDVGRSKVQSAQSAIEHACCLLLTSESFHYKSDPDSILSTVEQSACQKLDQTESTEKEKEETNKDQSSF